jgi:hypothetical protein
VQAGPSPALDGRFLESYNGLVNLPAVVFFVVIPLVVLVVILEGRRQARKYGKGRGTGVNLARTGLMELQSLLEPDRKVEVLREMERKEDLLVEVDDQAGTPPPR